MADADDFVRGETLDIFFGMLDASGLDHLFQVRNELKRSKTI